MAQSCHLFLQKAPSQISDWVLNKSLIIQGFFHYWKFRLPLRIFQEYISNAIGILSKYLEQKISLQLQQNYAPNMFKLNHKEPEECRQSCSVFFIANWGFGNMYFDPFHYCFDGFHQDSDHQANTVGNKIDPVMIVKTWLDKERGGWKVWGK